jgi:hypothetical protein
MASTTCTEDIETLSSGDDDHVGLEDDDEFEGDEAGDEDNGIARPLQQDDEYSDEIELKIESKEKELLTLNREENPEEWASAHLDLGRCFLMRSAGTRLDNIERALRETEKALYAITKEKNAQQWCIAKLQITSLYLNRVAGERSDNIESGIEHAEE